jgi:hypothetical protein
VSIVRTSGKLHRHVLTPVQVDRGLQLGDAEHAGLLTETGVEVVADRVADVEGPDGHVRERHETGAGHEQLLVAGIEHRQGVLVEGRLLRDTVEGVRDGTTAEGGAQRGVRLVRGDRGGVR